MPNKHEFKARLVCSFLRVILNGKIIDYRLPNLLRETSLIGNNMYFDKLKSILQQHTGSESDLLKRMIHFREEENKAVKIKPEKKEKVESKLHPEEALREKEKTYPVNGYFWSEVVKYLVQNGRILKLKDAPVKAAFHIFLQQLKKTQLVWAAKQHLKETDIQDVFLEFLGQLCQLDIMDSVEIIHNFLHFGCKTAEQYLHDPSFADNFAVGLAGPLCDALELTGKISDESPASDLNQKSASIEGSDYKFFTKLTRILLRHPIFKKPFEKNLYKQMRQNLELFARECEVQTQIEILSLRSPLPVLEEILGSFSMHSFVIPPALPRGREKRTGSSNGLMKMLLFGPEISHAVQKASREAPVRQYESYHKPLPPLPASAVRVTSDAERTHVSSEIKKEELASDSSRSERSLQLPLVFSAERSRLDEEVASTASPPFHANGITIKKP